jgi:hypothetical protein
MTQCADTECDRAAKSRGLCHKHYQRVRAAEVKALRPDLPKAPRKRRTKPAPPAGHTFRAVWPITNPALPTEALQAEAVADLPKLAAAANATLIGPAIFTVRPGKVTPGSQGAMYAMVATAPAEPAAARIYRRTK